MTIMPQAYNFPPPAPPSVPPIPQSPATHAYGSSLTGSLSDSLSAGEFPGWATFLIFLITVMFLVLVIHIYSRNKRPKKASHFSTTSIDASSAAYANVPPTSPFNLSATITSALTASNVQGDSAHFQDGGLTPRGETPRRHIPPPGTGIPTSRPHITVNPIILNLSAAESSGSGFAMAASLTSRGSEIGASTGQFAASARSEDGYTGAMGTPRGPNNQAGSNARGQVSFVGQRYSLGDLGRLPNDWSLPSGSPPVVSVVQAATAEEALLHRI